MADWSTAVDDGACIGSGLCTSTAPGRFVLGADGRSRPAQPEVDADPAVVAAAESCPAEAITVIEISSGAVLAP